jgi:hypothetical protein
MGEVTDVVANAKKWWQSKTIIGTILMILPMLISIVAPEANIDVSGAVDTAWEGAEGLATFADSIWSQGLEAFGFVLAIYGRLKANVGIK